MGIQIDCHGCFARNASIVVCGLRYWLPHSAISTVRTHFPALKFQIKLQWAHLKINGVNDHILDSWMTHANLLWFSEISGYRKTHKLTNVMCYVGIYWCFKGSVRCFAMFLHDFDSDILNWRCVNENDRFPTAKNRFKSLRQTVRRECHSLLFASYLRGF